MICIRCGEENVNRVPDNETNSLRIWNVIKDVLKDQEREIKTDQTNCVMRWQKFKVPNDPNEDAIAKGLQVHQQSGTDQ